MKSLKAIINKIKKPMAKISSWVCILFEKPITHLIIRIGCLFAFFFAYYLSLNQNKMKYNNVFFEFLNDWQTLIAGALALLGAFITVRQMQKSEEDRIYRRSLAYRAKLHSSILEIEKYANNLISYLFNSNNIHAPSLPSLAFSILEEITEYLDLQSAEYINNMLDCHQKVLRNYDSNSLARPLAKIDSIIFRAFINKIKDYCEGKIIILPREVSSEDIDNIQRLNSSLVTKEWAQENISTNIYKW